MVRLRLEWAVPDLRGHPVSQVVVAGMAGLFLTVLGFAITFDALPWLPDLPLSAPVPSIVVIGEGAVGLGYCAVGLAMLYDARRRLARRWLRTAVWSAAWACLVNTWLYLVGLLILGPTIPIISLAAVTSLLVGYTIIAFWGLPLAGRDGRD